MKKLICTLLVFTMMLAFAIPAMAASVGVSTTSLTIEKGKTATFSISASDAQAWATVSSANPSIASVNVTDAVWVENSSSTVTVTGKSVGKTTITVNFPEAASADGNVDLSGASRTITVNVVEPTTKPVQTTAPKTTAPKTTAPKTTASTAANLKSLTVEGFELNEKFSGGRTSYSITVPKDTKSINVSALPLNSNCKVTGTGTLNITGLPQTFRIVCKAPNGETKTYTLTVKAAADPTIVNLTDLVVSSICELTPEFDPSVYEYTAIVPVGTKAVNVDAIIDEVTYEGATVKVVGADDLAASNNTVTITVTAKDGTETTYTIHVKFAEEEKTVAPAPVEEKSGVPVWVVILLVVLLIVCSVVAFLLGKKKGEEAYDDSDDGYDDNSFEEIDRDSFIHSVDD